MMIARVDQLVYNTLVEPCRDCTVLEGIMPNAADQVTDL